MRPKGKLFALLAVFMAIAVVAATGAFTTVSAERTAEVNVAGDSNALIGIEPGPDNGDYVDTSDGEVSIALNNAPSVSVDGVNNNATTKIDGILTIQNNGGNDVTVQVNRSGSNSAAVSFYNETDYSAAGNITGSSGTVTLTPGDTVNVSMEIDTNSVSLDTSSSNQELINTITIIAKNSSA